MIKITPYSVITNDCDWSNVFSAEKSNTENVTKLSLKKQNKIENTL